MRENPGDEQQPRRGSLALLGDELESHIGHVRRLPVGAVEAELGVRRREAIRRLLGILRRDDVPLAGVAGLVARVAERLGDAFDRGPELDTVAHHAVVMSVLARHQAGAIGATDRRVRHGGVQPGALPGEGVEKRRAGVGVAVAAHRVRPLHVGEDEQDVGPARGSPVTRGGAHATKGRGQSQRPCPQEGTTVQCRRHDISSIHNDLTPGLQCRRATRSNSYREIPSGASIVLP